jgi:nitroreductase
MSDGLRFNRFGAASCASNRIFSISSLGIWRIAMSPTTSSHEPGEHDSARLKEAAELLRIRYRNNDVTQPSLWNDVLSTLLSHRSIRTFLPDPVPREALDLAIAAAQSAASSQNLQIWSVVAVEDQDRIRRLSDLSASQGFIRKVPLFLAWLADLTRLSLVAKERGVSTETLHHLEPFIISIIDATLAAQNAVVAFESLGFGTVYIGALRYEPEKVIAELALPPHVLPIFGLCVGYPDPTVSTGIKPRLPLPTVLHHEHYNFAGQRQAINEYDSKMHQFQKEQGITPVNWSANSVDRVEILQQQILYQHYSGRLKRLGFAR